MSVVTAIAATGLVISATGAGMSFAQAAKAKKRAAIAAKEQKALMESAKKRAEKNFYAGLNVPLDAFGEEYRQNIAANQQMLQQLQEGDPRNLAAGVGALGQATAEANEATRIGMQKDLYANAKMKADAREKIKQQFIEMDVGAAADEAMRERDAQRERAQAIQSGVANLGSMVSQGAQMVPLFSGGAKNQATLDAAMDQQVEGEAPGTTQVIKTEDGQYKVWNPNDVVPNPAFETDKTQPEFIPGYQTVQVGGQDASTAQILKMIEAQGLSQRDVGRLSRDKYDFGGSGKRGSGGWSDFNWDFLYQ